MSLLAPTLQAFFTDRLTGQGQASAHTITAYRDTIRLLLAFAAEHSGKPPSELDIDDLQAPLIGAFLDHLEHERGNTIRTRNARLAAIRSLFSLRRATPSRARRHDPTRPGDSDQAPRSGARHVPHRARAPGTA